MPVHDWTRVDAGIFHDFHHTWITEIKRALNGGLLPPDHYALAEQIAGGLGPDVLTLQRPANGAPPPNEPSGGVILATAPPKVQFRLRAEPDLYAAKAKAVTIRHASDHRVIAVIEIVSPGNKNNRHGLRAFVGKALELLKGGIHLLIVDLFPPGPRDPQGIHKAIWDEIEEGPFELPPDKPMTLAAYVATVPKTAYVEPVGIGDVLLDMPAYLDADTYVPVPLEATYQATWASCPEDMREAVERGEPLSEEPGA